MTFKGSTIELNESDNVSVATNGSLFLLRLPNGQEWKFEAEAWRILIALMIEVESTSTNDESSAEVR